MQKAVNQIEFTGIYVRYHSHMLCTYPSSLLLISPSCQMPFHTSNHPRQTCPCFEVDSHLILHLFRPTPLLRHWRIHVLEVLELEELFGVVSPHAAVSIDAPQCFLDVFRIVVPPATAIFDGLIWVVDAEQ